MMVPLPALDPVLVHVAAATLGAVLLLGGVTKLLDLPLLRAVMDDYRLLPKALLLPVSLLLPLSELAGGALLLPAATRGAGALLALALLCTVTAAVGINLARGRRHISCGCGGDDHVPLSHGIVLRNVALALLAVAALCPVQARDTVWLDPVATAFATLFLLGLYLTVNQLLAHHPRLLALKDAP